MPSTNDESLEDSDEAGEAEDATDAGDDASDERSLFGRRREESHLYVATGLGIARVDVADGRVGQFSLAERCECTSIAASHGMVIAGTADGVLVDAGDGFTPADDPDAGRIAAVGVDQQWFTQARESGVVRRRGRTQVSWDSVGRVQEPRALAGIHLAAADGVYRVGDNLRDLGLTAVNDVALTDAAARTDPDHGRMTLLAGTDEGLYRHAGQGWDREHDTAVSVVESSGDNAFAVSEQGVLEAGDDGWTVLEEQPGGELVDLAIRDRVYGITGDGTIWMTDAPLGEEPDFRSWRSFSIGVRDAVEVAIG